MLRIAQRIPQLRVLVNTIITSLRHVVSICLVLFMLIFVYACVGMHLFGRCTLLHVCSLVYEVINEQTCSSQQCREHKAVNREQRATV